MDEMRHTAIDIDARLETSTETNHETTKLNGGVAPVAVDKLQISMKKRLRELPGGPFLSPSVTIFRLPDCLHEINKDLFEPAMIAIGPYHHGKKSLQSMEEHKWYTLRDLLAHNKNVDFEVYLQAMRSIEEQARQCYSETVSMGSDDFVMMLLLDGSFILGWFSLLDCVSKGHPCNMDTIFAVGWAYEYISSDLLLLENQLPFSVIHKLMVTREQGNQNCEAQCPLLQSLRVFQGQCFGGITIRLPKVPCRDIHHFLHIFYLIMVPDSQPQPQTEQGKSIPDKTHNFCGLGSSTWSKFLCKKREVSSDSGEPSDHDPLDKNIQCVSELHDAGIKFKRKKKPTSMLDISFKNGTIEMPLLVMDPNSIRSVCNMAAFEQSRTQFKFPLKLTSYLALMDSLINTEKDVAILERCDLVNNMSQNNEAAAIVFSQFYKNNFILDYGDHYFHGLFKDIKEYSKSTWHGYRARLMDDYFSNPWTIISVVAAGILLILTFIQTYYSAAK